MNYFYKPGANRVALRRPIPTPRAKPMRYRAPKITGKHVALAFLAVGLTIGIWFGAKSTKGWLAQRREDNLAAEQTALDTEKKQIEESARSRITSRAEAVTVWQEAMGQNQAYGAEVAARLALEYQPNWRDGYLMLGAAQIAQREYEEALKTLLQAQSIDPTYPPTHQMLAEVYKKTGDTTRADSETQKAIALSEKTGIALE